MGNDVLANDVEEFALGDYTALVSKINGDAVVVKSDKYDIVKDKWTYCYDAGLFEPISESRKFEFSLIPAPTFSVHVSSKCNMACKYCFKKTRTEDDLTVSEIERFLNMMFEYFPSAERYTVDMAGSGEPLLSLDAVLKIADYCHKKSDEVHREVLPTLVSNGLMLTAEVASKLQEAGILFGVSIDGGKKAHDKNRVDCGGCGTYDRIVANVRSIEHRDFVGAAVTVGKANSDVLKIHETLSELFPTVSIKPVREEGNFGGTVKELVKRYTALCAHVIAEFKKGSACAVKRLMNGDDYFGKFILRVLSGEKVITRCDAGLGRFSLAPDRNIYACAAACDKKEFVIGTLDGGLDMNKIEGIWNILSAREGCGRCSARFACGGECMLVSQAAHGRLDAVDGLMCVLKRHLFALALKIKAVLSLECGELYGEVIAFTKEVAARRHCDEELIALSDALDGINTYTELKRIKDTDAEAYRELVTEYIA